MDMVHGYDYQWLHGSHFCTPVCKGWGGSGGQGIVGGSGLAHVREWKVHPCFGVIIASTTESLAQRPTSTTQA